MGAGSGVAAALAIIFLLPRAANLGLVQAPNARSSHIRPSPTGGGVGSVLGSSFAGLFALSADWRIAVAILLVSLGFAALGLWDDIRPLSAARRLAIQSALVLAGIGAMLPQLQVATIAQLPLPLVLAGVALLLVYWVNLYNFMDGI